MTQFSLFRLLMIMCLMIYGTGCLFYLLTGYITTEKPNFVEYHGLQDNPDLKNLVIMLYFSLTVLSTVGYGDFFPVVEHEMVMTVLIMLMGVAVFSWIMGEIKDVLSKQAMGRLATDRRIELAQWHLCNERFGGRVMTELIIESENELQYYWDNNRADNSMAVGNEDLNLTQETVSRTRLPSLIVRIDADCLVEAVKVQLISKYLYRDIGQNLLISQTNDAYFIYQLKRALKPRFYKSSTEDAIIAEEGATVFEALFVSEGIIEIGFTRLTSYKHGQSAFIMGYRQRG